MFRIFRILAWLFGGIVLIVALMIAMAFGVLDVLGPSVSQNFRLSIVIDDNGREFAGSTVFRVRTMMFSPTMDVTEERAVVDLGDRGFLFVAAAGYWGRYAELYLAESFCIEPPPRKDLDDTRYQIFKQIKKLPEGSFIDLTEPLPERTRNCKHNTYVNTTYDELENDRKNNPPLLIRFRDFSDPSTVEKVDPLNLEATYGPGVKLVRIRMETTSAPVSRSMEPAPDWLREGVSLQTSQEKRPFSSHLITGLLLYEVQRKDARKRHGN